MFIQTENANTCMGAEGEVEHPQAGDGLSPANIREILAPLRGLRFLMKCIGANGLQSWISPHPKFPESQTTPLDSILQARIPPAAREKFAALGGGLPEGFTAMLALKMLGPLLGKEAAPLVAWVRDMHLPGAPRYHFFANPQAIAADTDCTGVALSGLYEVGAISRDMLRDGAEHILGSAAAESLEEEDNQTHGKHNGRLIEGVLKVYWDDDMQGEAALRGRKHDPTCVANALHAVLLAVRHAGLHLDGTIVVSEIRADGSRVSTELSRRDIVSRNIAYLIDCLDRSKFASGTRYYPSPDAFLCFASELVRDFPEETADLRAPLLEALSLRWHAQPGSEDEPACPQCPVNLAMRVIAAQNIGVRMSAIRKEIATLRRTQARSGAWPAGALFKLGSMRYYFGSESMTTLFALRALLGHHSMHDDWIAPPMDAAAYLD